MKVTPIVLLSLVVLFSTAKALPTKKSTEGCLKRPSNIGFRVRKRNVIDLSYVTNEFSAYWPNSPEGFKLTEKFRGFVTGVFSYFLYYNGFSQPEHLGTHMDAPIHFSQTGNAVHEVGLKDLIGEGLLVDMTVDGKRFNESLITLEHLLEWENERVGGQIRSGGIIMLRTGYGDYYYDPPEYWGTNKTGAESVPFLTFPGLHPDAARWLVEKRCIAAIGIDTPSIDEGQAKRPISHEILSAANVPIFENVANLDEVAKRGKRFKIIALPYKMEGASGAPTRIIAVTS